MLGSDQQPGGCLVVPQQAQLLMVLDLNWGGCGCLISLAWFCLQVEHVGALMWWL